MHARPQLRIQGAQLRLLREEAAGFIKRKESKKKRQLQRDSKEELDHV